MNSEMRTTMRDNRNSQENNSGGVGIFILFIIILFLICLPVCHIA